MIFLSFVMSSACVGNISRSFGGDWCIFCSQLNESRSITFRCFKLMWLSLMFCELFSFLVKPWRCLTANLMKTKSRFITCDVCVFKGRYILKSRLNCCVWTLSHVDLLKVDWGHQFVERLIVKNHPSVRCICYWRGLFFSLVLFFLG